MEMKNLTKEISSDIVVVRVADPYFARLSRGPGNGGGSPRCGDVRTAARRAGSRRRLMVRVLEGKLPTETEGEARPEDLVIWDEGLLGTFSVGEADPFKGNEEMR